MITFLHFRYTAEPAKTVPLSTLFSCNPVITGYMNNLNNATITWKAKINDIRRKYECSV